MDMDTVKSALQGCYGVYVNTDSEILPNSTPDRCLMAKQALQ